METKDIDPNPKAKAKERAVAMVEATDPRVSNSGDCKFCGTQHPPGKCPAYGQQCHKCNGKNHFG